MTQSSDKKTKNTNGGREDRQHNIHLTGWTSGLLCEIKQAISGGRKNQPQVQLNSHMSLGIPKFQHCKRIHKKPSLLGSSLIISIRLAFPTFHTF